MARRNKQMQVALSTRHEIGFETVICDRCGATVDTMPDKCDADLAEKCPGFLRYDAVRSKHVKRVYKL